MATLIETLGLDGCDRSLPRVLQVHPAVLDTSALLSDLITRVRSGRETLLLHALEFGVVRGFAAHHVWAEMPRKIADKGAKGIFDAAVAETVWWREYVPLLRFVDTATLSETEHYRALVARDHSDGPTERLRGLLAPVVVLAKDKDLIALGLAANEWKPVADAGGEVAMAGGGVVAGTSLVMVSGYGMWQFLVLLGRVIRRWPKVAVGFALAGGAAAVTRERWAHRTQSAVTAAGGALRRTATAVGEIITYLIETADAAFARWDAAVVGTPGNTLVHHAARVLAVSPSPLTRSELAHRLAAAEAGSERRLVKALRPILEGGSAFVAVDRTRWQLGRDCVDFGLAAELASDIDEDVIERARTSPLADTGTARYEVRG